MSFAGSQGSVARRRIVFGAPAGAVELRRGPFEARWTPLARLEPGPWRDLARRADEPNVFLEPAFALAAARHLGGGDVGALTLHEGGRLLALLPGRVEGLAAARPVPVFVAWTHPFAPLSLPLLDREAAADAMPVLIEALGLVPGAPRAALFSLLPEAGMAACLIARTAEAAGRPVLRLDAHARAVLLPGAAPARASKELRRQRRRLAEAGTLAHETATAPGAVQAALAEFVALEERGWKGRAGTAAACDPAAARFISQAVAALAAEGKACIDRLVLDGRTIAAAITLFSGDRAWFWKIAYDETLARFSPGVQVTLDLGAALAADRGLVLVDSCAIAHHPMIDRLWAGRMAVADWLVPLAGPASFALAAAAERARRAARAPLRALRDRWRR